MDRGGGPMLSFGLKARGRLSGAVQSRRNLVFGRSKDPNHDAVMRIGSEAPKRRTKRLSNVLYWLGWILAVLTAAVGGLFFATEGYAPKEGTIFTGALLAIASI